MIIEDLKERLINQKADFEILEHNIPIKSKKDAEGYFKMEETAPTLIIQSEAGYYALVLSGERNKVDFEMLRNLLECEIIRLADKKEIIEKFNIQPGQIPLIGHNLPCIIDNKIFKHQYVYGGSGDLYFTLKINPKDLLLANKVILRFD